MLRCWIIRKTSSSFGMSSDKCAGLQLRNLIVSRGLISIIVSVESLFVPSSNSQIFASRATTSVSSSSSWLTIILVVLPNLLWRCAYSAASSPESIFTRSNTMTSIVSQNAVLLYIARVVSGMERLYSTESACMESLIRCSRFASVSSNRVSKQEHNVNAVKRNNNIFLIVTAVLVSLSKRRTRKVSSPPWLCRKKPLLVSCPERLRRTDKRLRRHHILRTCQGR